MRLIIFLMTLLASLILLTGVSTATHYDAQRIRRWADNTPRKQEDSLSTLAKHLTKPLDDDYDKAMAIAFWIAGHINYDEYLYNSGGTTKLIKTYRGQDADELLKSRVGICGDFAELFVELCKRAGIKAYIVHGYAYPARKYISVKQKLGSGHAWNYFTYKSKKIYVDTTFMAKGTTGIDGSISNYSHRRALKNIQKENKLTSQTNDFDMYYFDFTYKDETRTRNYTHEER